MDVKVNGKKRKGVEKPLCKYGLACYQKNPEHRKKFKHPSAKGENAKKCNENSLNDASAANISNELIKNEENKTESIAQAAIEITEELLPSMITEASYPKDSSSESSEEVVGKILKSMPKDFFDFWKFCASINKSNPESAFSQYGYHLVGIFDLLAKKLPKNMKVDILCHWRYFYDPPEFQTVIKKDGVNYHHIGYFRDDPSEKPSILASNSAAKGSKLTLMGDNIFCAMNLELEKVIQASKSETTKNKATNIKNELIKFASENKYALNIQTNKIKRRQKLIVAKTFHGLGIVVPVKDDVGYRPLPDSDGEMKNILKKIAASKSEKERIKNEENLDEIVTDVQFANDECDFGMGLELGIDLFCYGESCLHKYILLVLPLAYDLLQRSKYALIVKAHLKNRKEGDDLSTLRV